MVISQFRYVSTGNWIHTAGSAELKDPDLIFVFGGRLLLEKDEIFDEISIHFNYRNVILASTSGEICGSKVYDDSLVLTAVKFARTPTRTAVTNIKDFEDAQAAGEQLANLIPHDGLNHLFVISDGQMVNGTQLVEGLSSNLPKDVAVTGGLAGDSGRFEKTLVGFNKKPEPGNIVVVGFYGSSIRIGYGSMGGWDPFGPVRLVTKSNDNVLYELDGKSALNLYKTYLGDKASGLPGTALLFPLAIQTNLNDEPIVRTILSVNEADQSMTFAGDIPTGSYGRFMKANFDRLIDGASVAAHRTISGAGDESPELAILISCVGRKLVLGQRVEEEVEAVAEVLGGNSVIAGFYSYGEISPFSKEVKCELHNQTMTITTFREI